MTFVVWVLLLAVCFAVPVIAGSGDPGDAFTRNTARLTVACYGLAVLQMTQMRGDERRAVGIRGRTARWCWTLGVVTFFIHVATAYHFIHHWSQEDAIRHTREVSGVGEGVYVSLAFGWLWLLDAVWWQWRPQYYAIRPRWIGDLLHAFLAFIVFNGTVVYEQGPIRWAGAALFLLLGALLLSRQFGQTAMRN